MSDAPVLLVRTVIARHLRVPVAAVLARHVLSSDLAIDAIDLAFISIDLEDATDLELVMPDLDEEATVQDLAESLVPLFDARFAPRLRAGGMR